MPSAAESAGAGPIAGPTGSGTGSRPRIGAIILSGGRARRMGGVGKTALDLAGATLLSRTAAAARAACDGAVVIVGAPPEGQGTGAQITEAGPIAGSTRLGAARAGVDTPYILRSAPSSASGVVVMREEPPGGGPVAAIVAAIGRVDADEVLLLAGDLAEGDRAVAALLAARPDDAAGADGVVLVDEAGASGSAPGCGRRRSPTQPRA